MRISYKKHFLFLCFVLASLVILFCYFFIHPQICFKNRCVNIELATTSEARTKGLMFRNLLPKKRGMLFVFPKDDYYSIWMKNTYIPLDIIWLDQNVTVVYIVENAPTRSTEILTSPEKARYVLEVNSGFIQENNIKVGDRAKFFSFITL